jgi:hypothetical protein
MATHTSQEQAPRSTPNAEATQAARESIDAERLKIPHDIGPSGLQLIPRSLARRIATLVLRRRAMTREEALTMQKGAHATEELPADVPPAPAA